MANIHDDQDLYIKLFENKMNSNLFKFLVREYFSNSMNPFLILKMLSKILFSNISKLLKLKYVHFFLTILKRLTINEKLLKEHINPIIADTLEHILTRKADYVIIVQYAIFLVQIGQIDFALSRLQIFSTDLRFINNGELVFYRGLIDYVDDAANSSENTFKKTFLSFFHKGLTLLKKKEREYGEFIIDFLVSKNMLHELKEFLKHDKIKEIFDRTDKKKFRLLSILADCEFMDLFRKISIVSEELDKNFTDFSLLLKFFDLVETYYEEKTFNKISTSNYHDVDMIKYDGENKEEDFNSNSHSRTNSFCSKSFAERVAFLGNKHLIIYLKFLSAFIIFEPFNTKCLSLLGDVLSYLKYQYFDLTQTNIMIKNQDETQYDSKFSNDEEIISIRKLVLENNSIFIEFLLKEIIVKQIFKLHKKFEYLSSCYKIKFESGKNSYGMDDHFSKFSKNIQDLRPLFDIIELNNELVTGNKISHIYNYFLSPLCEGFFNQSRKDLMSWTKLIKKIKK